MQLDTILMTMTYLQSLCRVKQTDLELIRTFKKIRTPVPYLSALFLTTFIFNFLNLKSRIMTYQQETYFNLELSQLSLGDMKYLLLKCGMEYCDFDLFFEF